MRWAFLGIGRVTPRMVEAIRMVNGHEIVAAVARDSDALNKWCERHSVTQSSADFHRWCESPEIDAVYVALPPHLHFEYIRHAILNGKTVLSEKPLVMNHEQALEIAQLTDEHNASVHQATAFPFHPRSQAMKQIIASGELGEVKRIIAAFSASHILNRGRDYRTDPTLGGGCLLDLGWYCSFATQWLTGLSVVDVSAMGTKSGQGVWISAQAIVRLSNGAIAHWDSGFDAAGRKWIEVAGSQGSVICDDFLRPWDLAKPRFWVHGSDGKARAELIGTGFQQEVAMVEHLAKGRTQESEQLLSIAVESHRHLDLWEKEMNDRGSDGTIR